MVAIVKAISRDAKLIIFDEPTAILGEKEVKKLFQVIKLLKQRGLAVIYISHRLEEIFEICDTISVLKDGESAGDRDVGSSSKDDLIKLMVGRKLTQTYYSNERKRGEEVLNITDLGNEYMHNCSFQLHKGEILGIYGLVGAGRTELCRAIFGADKATAGEIAISSKKVKITSPRDAIKNGFGFIPEDRRGHGLALPLSVKYNLNMTIYRNNNWFGFIRRKIEHGVAEKYIKSLKIKTPSENQKVMNLSGGNQQKVVVGKWLAGEAKTFIMDEPTNGIDVGAKEEIYSLVNQLASEGASVIFISSYMPELIDLCDRILVMRDKTIVRDFPRAEFNEEKILTTAIQQLN